MKERALVLRKSVSAGEVSIHSLATLLVDDYRAYEATHFTLHHEALLELYHDQLDQGKHHVEALANLRQKTATTL